MAKGPHQPRRNRDGPEAGRRRTPPPSRRLDREPRLRDDGHGQSAKQVARELAKLEQRLAEARRTHQKRQRQVEESAADVASLVSDVQRLHAALTAIEVASAPDIAALVEGLDEEIARLEGAEPVRRRRRVPVPAPVVPAESEAPAAEVEPAEVVLLDGAIAAVPEPVALESETDLPGVIVPEVARSWFETPEPEADPGPEADLEPEAELELELEPEAVAAEVEVDIGTADDEPPAEPDAADEPEPATADVEPMHVSGNGVAPSMPIGPIDVLVDPSEEVRVCAAIDVGSNSIHLLAAVVADHELRPLIDESELLGLGPVVDEKGALSHKRGDSLAAIRAYIEEARDLHASDITVIGTEPMRRAADSTRLNVELQTATGTGIHVVDHVEEALLTLIGVTGGWPVESELGVVDVGGGSSEIVLVGPGRPPIAGGLRVGSNRLTASIVRHDPPTKDEIELLRAEARVRIASAPDGSPELLIVVGGTATNLLRVLPGPTLDRTLTRKRLADALAVLATEPAAEAARRHATSVMRARILPAGAAIMEALLERYGLDRLHVSDAGIREGTILAVAHAGPNWRDQLPQLALGWRVSA